MLSLTILVQYLVVYCSTCCSAREASNVSCIILLPLVVNKYNTYCWQNFCW